MQAVIVLNAEYMPIGTTRWEEAVRLIYLKKAEVVAETDRQLHPTMKMPLVIRLLKAIRFLWRKEVPWSKVNVHVRDEWTCQYCGEKLARKDATIDHVIPQAQGGKSTWPNTVTACFGCNNQKQDRTPDQAKMHLIKRPKQPTIMEFVLQDIRHSGAENLLRELGIMS